VVVEPSVPPATAPAALSEVCVSVTSWGFVHVFMSGACTSSSVVSVAHP
jgi:hypothetical protein